jgi:hypothetical protein
MIIHRSNVAAIDIPSAHALFENVNQSKSHKPLPAFCEISISSILKGRLGGGTG